MTARPINERASRGPHLRKENLIRTIVLRDSVDPLPEVSVSTTAPATALPAPPPTRTREERSAAIISMRKTGATYKVIAKALGEYESTVHRVLRRHGLPDQPDTAVHARRDAEIMRSRLAGPGTSLELSAYR